MIGALKGTVYSTQKNPVILFVGGVGYVVFVPDHIRHSLHAGDVITLMIHTRVRDDALELYGFQTADELTLFELLLTVPGIGPKTALPIIDRGTARIEQAVRVSDVDFFTTIPRLGKKNAQKIIIELKNKLGSIKELNLMEDASSETKDLVNALLGMGFEKKEVVEAIKKLGSADMTLEQKIRHALKLLG